MARQTIENCPQRTCGNSEVRTLHSISTMQNTHRPLSSARNALKNTYGMPLCKDLSGKEQGASRRTGFSCLPPFESKHLPTVCGTIHARLSQRAPPNDPSITQASIESNPNNVGALQRRQCRLPSTSKVAIAGRSLTLTIRGCPPTTRR